MMKQAKKSARVKPVLKTGYENKDGLHPVKIRVTHDRIRKYYPVKLEGKPLFKSEADFDKLNKTDKRKDANVWKEEVKDLEAAAREAIKTVTKGGVFTFDRFEKEFLTHESKNGMLHLFDKYLKELLAENRIGSYESYKSAYHSFNKFRGGKTQTKDTPLVRGKEIMPEDLTTDVLKRYDGWLKESGCNKTSIGIYMRALRIIYNNAVDINPSLAEFYPFSKKQNDNKRYRIRSGSGQKGQAMPVEDLRKFMKSSPIEGSPEWEAKQYWLFMFYASGMNMADVAALQYENVKWDAIRYVRKKTMDTEGKEEKIEIPLSEALKKIILSIGSPDKSPSAFVFPILDKSMDPLKVKAVTKQKTKILNKWLSRLCLDNDLPEITTYWSRHTSATLLRDSGASVEMISELLGHSDVKVTREYLKRFSIAKKAEVIDVAHESVMKAVL